MEVYEYISVPKATYVKMVNASSPEDLQKTHSKFFYLEKTTKSRLV
jgi:hypothetical protein